MAVVVYKDGNKEIVDALLLQSYLDDGYLLTKEPVKQEEVKAEESPMSDYERELRDKIKALGGKVGGRASLKTIEAKLKELEEAE